MISLFKDLATMVHEQGDIVDSIESNIESTSVQVTTGTEQLRQVIYSQMTLFYTSVIILFTGLRVSE